MNSTKMQVAFVAYFAFLCAGVVLLLFICFDSLPVTAPQSTMSSNEPAMLEACADMLAKTLDKQPYIDHHVSDDADLTIAVKEKESNDGSKSKILRFPSSTLFGEVQVGEFSHNKAVMPSGWVRCAEASGNIAVDPSKPIRLLVHPGAKDLTATSSLDANDVQYLDLSRTPIENDQLKSIMHLAGLLILNLHNCSIDDNALPYLARFKRLLFLDFGGTTVSDKAVLLASSLPELRILVFSKCPNVTGKYLSKLQHVNCLLMDESGFNSEGVKEAASMKELTELYADGTHINDADLKLLQRTKIASLTLARTSVTRDGLKFLNANLRRIDLDDCNIDDGALSTLGQRSALLVLSLAGTSITDTGLQTIMSDSNLEQLDLSRTKVSNVGVSKLSCLMKLRRVVLPPGISDRTISLLRHQLPKCQVIQHYD